MMIALLSLLPMLVCPMVEWTPDVTATGNVYVPYDVTGPEAGVSVDAIYLSPGGKEHAAACFWYQPMAGLDGVLSAIGEARWLCRFRPDEPGTWQRKATVTDQDGTRETRWQTFGTDCVPGRGRLVTDEQKFQFEDGSAFPYPLINVEYEQPLNSLAAIRTNLATWGAHGLRFVRWFPNDEGANYNVAPFGGTVSIGWNFGDGGMREDTAAPGGRFSWQPYYYSTQSIPLRPGVHHLTVWALAEGEQALRLSLGTSSLDLCGADNVQHATCSVKASGWHTYTLTLTLPVTQTTTVALRGLYVSTDAPAPYNQVRSGRVRLGPAMLDDPNQLYRSDPNMYRTVDQRAAALLDEILAVSEQVGVYHKLTVFHKNDYVLNYLDGPRQASSASFYSGTLAQWYEAAYTRYFLARWGAYNSLHSLELANENHLTQDSYEAGWAFAGRVQADSDALVSNSFWGWWVGEFFDDPRLDHGDQHWYARQNGTDNPELVSVQSQDAAAYVRECQLRFRQYQYDRPLVRGEGGVWADGAYTQLPVTDEYYHDMLWAQLGGGNCWGEWWPRYSFLLGEFAAYEQFLSWHQPLGTLGTDLGNIVASNPGLQAWGDESVLWVDNVARSWSASAPPVSGTLSVPSMTGNYRVYITDLLTGETITTTAWHGLAFDVTVARDAAVRIVRFRTGQTRDPCCGYE